MSWMRTFTGKRFDPYDLEKAEFCIEDIAHALSNICRFVGHSSEFYSVAQHSVYVAAIVKHVGAPPVAQLAALLHDASEAYLTDVPSPLKYHESFSFYRELEEKVQSAILAHFKMRVFADSTFEVIKFADRAVLAAEARDLMGDPQDWGDLGLAWQQTIVPVPPVEAKAMFLKKYEELLHGRNALHHITDAVP